MGRGTSRKDFLLFPPKNFCPISFCLKRGENKRGNSPPNSCPEFFFQFSPKQLHLKLSSGSWDGFFLLPFLSIHFVWFLVLRRYWGEISGSISDIPLKSLLSPHPHPLSKSELGSIILLWGSGGEISLMPILLHNNPLSLSAIRILGQSGLTCSLPVDLSTCALNLSPHCPHPPPSKRN
jgi:hypothetical protein